uniref:Uncharacterized protein n=1 Tax=Serratia marcescens TaxID=615 RepID=A0A345IQV1_SERMA|nr:hypothetical protein [Serratia marcescens]AXH02223.1 hypothetical protein [Serratia marcescens]AXH02341.1 hypothetical protein [Serratia marcescens]AXH02630.1 hypothetical protein [Serratia marcescens]AXH02897.1 hypothetical protein [Serratia marcescens]
MFLAFLTALSTERHSLRLTYKILYVDIYFINHAIYGVL